LRGLIGGTEKVCSLSPFTIVTESHDFMKIDKLLKRYRIEDGKHFRLKDHDPADTHGLKSELKPQAKELLADGVKELSGLQNILAAQDRWGLLLIFQAMDAAGKMARSSTSCRGESGGRGCVVVQGAVARSCATVFVANDQGDAGRDRSAFSTVRITRRCWWCGCIRRF